jgi:addiction module HigA family antidote
MTNRKYLKSRLNGEVVHPGRILDSEWMRAFGISQNELARMMGCSARRVNEIVHGRRAITADSALRLSRCLGFAPHYWLHLQADYEIERAMKAPRKWRHDTPPEPDAGLAVERLAQRKRPAGWQRTTTPEYRAAKRKEAILSYIDREDFLDSVECDNQRRPPPAV